MGLLAAAATRLVELASRAHELRSTERQDAFGSALAQLDAYGLDPLAGGFRLPRDLADLLYERTWLSVVADIVPDWGTQEGFTVPQLAGDAQERLASDLEDLAADQAVKLAWRFARQHGGGAVLKVIDDGRPPELPVDRAAIRRVTALIAVDRHELYITDWGSNGRTLGPLEYQDLNGTRWHPDRVVPFLNRQLAMRRREWYERWSVSEYERIYDAFLRDDDTQKAIAKIVKEYSYDVLHIKGLRHKDPAEIREVLKAIALSIAKIGRIALEADDRYTTQTKTLAGLPDSVNVITDRLAMITRIPASILRFASPGGLNMGANTGDWEAFLGLVAAEQRTHYVPAMASIVADVLASADGPLAGRPPPPHWKIQPRELGKLSPDKAAELRRANAEARKADLEAGVVTVEEARREQGLAELYSLIADAPDTAAPELDLALDLGAAAPTGQTPDAVEATALNGAQIAAILEVAARVHAGEITRDAALGILRLAFPGVAPEQLAAALPPEGAAPAPAPGGTQPTADDGPLDAEDPEGLEPAPSPGIPPQGVSTVGLAEIRQRYGAGKKAVLDLVAAKRVRAWKPGGRWRFVESEVAEAFLHQPPDLTEPGDDP